LPDNNNITEKILDLLKKAGVNIFELDKLVITAQQFNNILIDLERTANLFGKNLSTVRDELNAISVNFSLTQNVAKQFYQTMHDFGGIAIKDSKDQLAILQIVRNAYGPDENQIQQGITVLQKLIASNSDQQNQLVKIIQLKKMAMDGDKDANKLLQEQSEMLARNARLFVLLGHESGKTREEIGAMMMFAKSQSDADPLGEIIRKYNEAQMQIKNTPLVFMNMVAQIDAEKDKLTTIIQSLQGAFSSGGAWVNEAILGLYGPSSFVPKVETPEQKATREMQVNQALMEKAKVLNNAASAKVSALDTSVLSGEEEVAMAAKANLDDFVEEQKQKIALELYKEMMKANPNMDVTVAHQKSQEDAQKVVGHGPQKSSSYLLLSAFQEQKKNAETQLPGVEKFIEEGQEELADLREKVERNKIGAEYNPQVQAELNEDQARIAVLEAGLDAAKQTKEVLEEQAKADFKLFQESIKRHEIEDLIVKSFQDQGRELEKQFGTMRDLNNATSSILKLQAEFGPASAYSNDAAKTFNELQKRSMDYLGGQIEASRAAYEEVSKFNKLVEGAKKGNPEAAKKLAEESIKIDESELGKLQKAMQGAKNAEDKAEINTHIQYIEERMQRARKVIDSGGREGLAEILRDTASLVETGMKRAVEAVASAVENIKTSIENARAPAKELTSQLQAQKEVLDAQVSIADSLVTGLGASAEMRMAQAANSMEQAKSMQNELVSMQQQRADVEKEIAKNGDNDGRLRREVMEIRRQENHLASQILQKQKESLDSVKMLREGYLNAIQAMESGSGVFMEMVVTQEKGLGSLIRNIREVPRVLNTGTAVGPGAEKGVFGIGGLMGGTTGARGEYDNRLMVNSAQDLSKTINMLSNAVERFSSALPNMSALGFEGNKFQGAFIAGETGPTTALGARQASSAMQSADLASSFKEAFGDQMRPLAEAFKDGLETVFKSAFAEFRQEITDMIGDR
jgi:hypothetical protein